MTRTLEDRYDALAFAAQDLLGKIEGFNDADEDDHVAPAVQRLRGAGHDGC
jgi:hypothetical protein